MIEFTKEQLESPYVWLWEGDIKEQQMVTINLAAFALALMERAENAEAENAKLRACVKAADAYFQADANSVFPVETIYTERQIEESEHWLSVAVKCRDDYYAARTEVDNGQ